MKRPASSGDSSIDDEKRPHERLFSAFCRAVEEQQQGGVKRRNERVDDKKARNEKRERERERGERGFEYREQGKLT